MNAVVEAGYREVRDGGAAGAGSAAVAAGGGRRDRAGGGAGVRGRRVRHGVGARDGDALLGGGGRCVAAAGGGAADGTEGGDAEAGRGRVRDQRGDDVAVGGRLPAGRASRAAARAQGPEGAVEADPGADGADPPAARAGTVAGGHRRAVRGCRRSRCAPRWAPSRPGPPRLLLTRPGRKPQARTAMAARFPGSRTRCRCCRIRCRGMASGRWPGSGCWARVRSRCSPAGRGIRWPGCCSRCRGCSRPRCWPPPGRCTGGSGTGSTGWSWCWSRACSWRCCASRAPRAPPGWRRPRWAGCRAWTGHRKSRRCAASSASSPPRARPLTCSWRSPGTTPPPAPMSWGCCIPAGTPAPISGSGRGRRCNRGGSRRPAPGPGETPAPPAPAHAYCGQREVQKMHLGRLGRPGPGTGETWVTTGRGDPLLVVIAEPSASLAAQIRKLLPDLRKITGDGARPLLCFDRGGWSPDLFAEVTAAGFDLLIYRKAEAGKEIPDVAGDTFAAVAWTGDDGRERHYDLAESDVDLPVTSGGHKGETLTLRQVTRRDKGSQVHILTSRH